MPKKRSTIIDHRKLMKQVQSGDMRMLITYKSQNPDFHWCTLKYEQTGDTVLHCAARLGLLDVIRYLLSFHPPSVDCKNKDDKTPLHEAAQFSQVEAARILLENGSNINALKRADWTPLMLACTKTDLDTVQLLGESRALVNYRNKDGWTALHLACRTGNPGIFEYLIGKGANVEAKTKNGRSLLHVACLHGNREICEMLVSLGADVNGKDHCGNTPLHEGVLGRRKDICAVLIQNGADAKCTNGVDFNLLHMASSGGYDDMVEYVVEELSFDLNWQNSNGFTALHCACRKNHKSTYRVLCELGADKSLRDNFGRVADEYMTDSN